MVFYVTVIYTIYRDSFYNITEAWDDRLGGYEAPVGLTSVYGHQSHPLPLGPPSEVSSREEPPSTVRPSASMIEPTPNRRRADFSISHYGNKVVSEEHQYVRRGTLTTQPEGNQEVRTSMGTTLPSTTSQIKTTQSIRQPDSPMSKPLLQVEPQLQKQSLLMVEDRCIISLL